MIPEYWALIATYSDQETALLLSQRCGTIRIQHTYKDKNDTITTINGVISCIVWSDGHQEWYKNGQRHREDGPAVIFPNGFQEWYKHGQKHREDGPAIIYPNGDQIWCKDGQLHREDGAAVIRSDGYQAWYTNGLAVSARRLSRS